jgi:2-hydroxychromene-2-carboxylate isomerase
MTASVQFLFDIGSPNAYLCHKLLPAIEQRTGAQIEYLPILLGGLFKLSNNRSPMEAYAEIPNKRAYEQLEFKRFLSAHQLDQFRFNPHFPVNTLSIMRGAVAAKAMGVEARYVDALFCAMWEQRLNLGDPAVLQQALSDAGLDAPAILQRSTEPEIKEQLVANTQRAFERGAFGSPTFFVDEAMYFGKERLSAVEAEILKTR